MYGYSFSACRRFWLALLAFTYLYVQTFSVSDFCLVRVPWTFTYRYLGTFGVWFALYAFRWLLRCGMFGLLTSASHFTRFSDFDVSICSVFGCLLCSIIRVLLTVTYWYVARFGDCFTLHLSNGFLPCKLEVWEWVVKPRILDPFCEFSGWI